MGSRQKRGNAAKVRFAVLAVMAFAALCGCYRGPAATMELPQLVAQQEQKEVETAELNKALFEDIFARIPQYEEYTLQSGDLIQVSVFETEELFTEARIGARGFVTLPLLGPIKLAGLTTAEAERKIETLYGKDYLRDPHVNLFLKEQQGGKVTVLGEVQNPGTYDYPAPQQLLDVLALAGGFTEEAGRTVQIRRLDEETGQRTETLVVDMDQLIDKGLHELNIDIKGKDIVFVPKAGMVYLDGAIQNPGVYPIHEDMTVQEAILGAGGFSNLAQQSDIKLVRYTEEGKREVTQLGSKDMQTGMAKDLKVQDRDLIFVESNIIKVLTYGIGSSFRVGGIGISFRPPYR